MIAKLLFVFLIVAMLLGTYWLMDTIKAMVAAAGLPVAFAFVFCAVLAFVMIRLGTKMQET